MWESLLGVRHSGCPISDTSAAVESVSVQNLSKADIPGSRGRRLIRVRGDSEAVAEFARTCRTHESVVSFEQVSGDEGMEAYFSVEITYDEANPSLLSIFNGRGVFHHSGAISIQSGVEKWLVYTERKEAVQTLVDEIESYGNEVTLYRTVDLQEIEEGNNVEFGIFLSRLTSRQRTTFRTALELGYYDGDSDTTVADIADELDVHETTTWEHLNKAENSILTDIGNRMFSSIDLEATGSP